MTILENTPVAKAPSRMGRTEGEPRFGVNTATSLDDVAAHNWDLHPLTGERADQWAIRVSGNWRLFFRFEKGDVHLLDYDDYH